MLSTLRQILHVPSTAEREQAYLAGSVDRFDLESREREIRRGLFRTPRRQFGL